MSYGRAIIDKEVAGVVLCLAITSRAHELWRRSADQALAMGPFCGNLLTRVLFAGCMLAAQSL
jgi:hypothetical protein